MEHSFDIDQPVLDAGGMIGHITDYEVTDTGTILKVSWEDGRTTRNVAEAVYPVPEVKQATPTPKDMKDMVTNLATRAEVRAQEATPYDAESVIEAWDLNYSLGNALNHIHSAGVKGSDELNELTWAAYYLNRRIEKLSGKEVA